MADGKRWFKVWNCILSDPGFDELPNDYAGIWVRLGALLSKHGCNGNITVTESQFYKRTNTQKNDLENITKNLSNVNVEIISDCNGNITVTYKNWRKYQEITDSYMRVKKFRDKQHVTVTNSVTCNAPKEEKRREEKKKRKEKEEKKYIHGEFKNVLLTDEELQKLKDKFGDVNAKEWIKTMDEGVETKGYEYKSHYLAILKWAKNEENKPQEKKYL